MEDKTAEVDDRAPARKRVRDAGGTPPAAKRPRRPPVDDAACVFCGDPPAPPFSVRTGGRVHRYCVECLLCHVEAAPQPLDPLTQTRYSRSQLSRLRRVALAQGLAVKTAGHLAAERAVRDAYAEVDLLCRYSGLDDILSDIEASRAYILDRLALPAGEGRLAERAAGPLAARSAARMYARADALVDWGDPDTDGDEGDEGDAPLDHRSLQELLDAVRRDPDLSPRPLFAAADIILQILLAEQYQAEDE